MISTMFDLTKEELRQLRPLNTPKKIQDFLNTIPHNFEPKGDTCISPRRVLRERRAHCIEGAMLAAVALRLHGMLPLVMDLRATDHDFDHVVTLFQKGKFWGAISKTNHGVLRFREPIYQSVRELAMSYFHEYFLNDGRKTLRSFSVPVDLSRFDKKGWITAEEDVWYIPQAVDDAKHFDILTKSQIAGLRLADRVEREMGKITEWQKPGKKKVRG